MELQKVNGNELAHEPRLSAPVIQNLIERATKAKEHSHSPYSNFRVGCALLTECDTIITGTNIENVAYGPTICAERTAFVKAISEGKKNIKAVFITSDIKSSFISPCGTCRQTMIEFCKPDCEVYMTKCESTNYRLVTVGSLLPYYFNDSDLSNGQQVQTLCGTEQNETLSNKKKIENDTSYPQTLIDSSDSGMSISIESTN